MSSVSVVIPCYNGMPYLGQSLDSALAQTHRPVEVIVVDDGSKDDSAAFVERYAAQHSGDGPAALVRLIRQTNAGEPAARNTGIRAARGDWVAMLDTDDWWEPDKLRLQLDAAQQAGPDCVLVHTGVVHHFADGKVEPKDLAAPARRTGWCTAALLEPASIGHPSILVRRDALEEIGGYDPAFKQACDIDLYFRLSAVGAFAFVPRHLLHYRIHPKQMSAAQADQVGYHHRAVRKFFAAHPDIESKIGKPVIEAALADHVANKLESLYWRRRLDQWRQLLEYARTAELDNDAIAGWRRRARWPDWAIRLRDRILQTHARTQTRRLGAAVYDLTVAICTYKRHEPLEEALASLAECRPIAERWELLVVDNAGDPWVRELVERFAATGRLPARYAHEPRIGNSPARNHAVRAAQAPIVVFADDDVVFDAGWLEAMARAVREHSDCAFWGGRIEPIWPTGGGDTLPRWFDTDRCPMLGNMIVRYDRGREPRYWNGECDEAFYTANLALRTAAVADAGYFDLGMGYVGGKRWGGEDSWMIRTLGRAGQKGWYVTDAVVHHPVPPERLTKPYARWFAWRQGWMSVEFHRRENAGRVARWAWRAATQGLFGSLARWVGGAVRFDPSRAFAGQFMAIYNLSRLWHSCHRRTTQGPQP